MGAASVEACSALANFDGLVAATDAGATGDAGDAGPESPKEAGAGAGDAAISDATSSDSSDATGASFCSTLTPAPTFCDDFERDTNVQGGWTSVIATGPGAAVSLVADSQGRYARGQVGAGGLDNRRALLELKLPTSLRKLTVNFKMRAPASTAMLYAEIMTIFLNGSSGTYEQVVLSVAGGSDFGASSGLSDGGQGPSFSVTSGFTHGAWQDMSVVLDLNAATAVMSAGGMSGPQQQLFVPPSLTSASLGFGVDYIGTSSSNIPALTIDVDDVAVTYQ